MGSADVAQRVHGGLQDSGELLFGEAALVLDRGSGLDDDVADARGADAAGSGKDHDHGLVANVGRGSFRAVFGSCFVEAIWWRWLRSRIEPKLLGF